MNLPAELVQRIDTAARKAGVSREEFVREAVVRALIHDAGRSARERVRKTVGRPPISDAKMRARPAIPKANQGGRAKAKHGKRGGGR